MDPRFNPNCEDFGDIVFYYKDRALQLLRFGYKLLSISNEEFGAVALFSREHDTEVYVSIYIKPTYRGKGIFEKEWDRIKSSNDNAIILTSDDCDIEQFLISKHILFVTVPIYRNGYDIISKFYLGKKAERSGIPYINHIDEGLAIAGLLLSWNDARDQAYMLHPIFQSDDALKKYFYKLHITVLDETTLRTIIFVMEYRSVANEYLSKRVINSIEEIRLSPLEEVNEMLIMDKIQNRKDFLFYHQDHPRFNELDQYFKNWLERLKITEEIYQSVVDRLVINPTIIE